MAYEDPALHMAAKTVPYDLLGTCTRISVGMVWCASCMMQEVWPGWTAPDLVHGCLNIVRFQWWHLSEQRWSSVCSSLTPPAAHDAPISHLHSFANCPGTNTCSLQTTLQILKHKNQHQKAAKKTPWTRHTWCIKQHPTPKRTRYAARLTFFPHKTPSFFDICLLLWLPLTQTTTAAPWICWGIVWTLGSVLRHQHGIQRLSSHAALTSGLAAVQCRKMSSNMVEKFFTRFLLWEN